MRIYSTEDRTAVAVVTPVEFEAFIADVKAGFFDGPYFRPLAEIAEYVRLG